MVWVLDWRSTGRVGVGVGVGATRDGLVDGLIGSPREWWLVRRSMGNVVGIFTEAQWVGKFAVTRLRWESVNIE